MKFENFPSGRRLIELSLVASGIVVTTLGMGLSVKESIEDITIVRGVATMAAGFMLTLAGVAPEINRNVRENKEIEGHNQK